MIPLYKPYMPPLDDLDTILNSGELAYGIYGKCFEARLIEYFGTDLLMTVSSFHLSILTIFTALGLSAGDEIIVSPMACLASTQPLTNLGLKVIWGDVDPSTGTLSPESVKQRVSSKTRAIIHNHFCGYPGWIDEINAIGRQWGIPIIDDGIEAFGSEYNGKKIGCCGADITCFSFGAVRLPNTIDGAVIVFKDRVLYEKSLLIRDFGIDRGNFRDADGEIDINCDIYLSGYGAMMSNINSYIGVEQMNNIPSLLAVQYKNALRWDEYFCGKCDQIPIGRVGTTPNYWVYGIRVKEKREAILTFRALGYYASSVHVSNSNYSIFNNREELPGVEEFAKSFVALPCGWWVEAEDDLDNI